MSPFDFACRAKTFILGLISDAAASNLAMVKQMQQRCPQNTVVLHMKCAAHQVHLCSAPLWVGLGFLSDVFCTTNVLQSGPVWLDLQTFAQQIVEERFEVSFYPPHPDHQRFSKLVVEHTLLAGHDGDERDRKNKQELAARLLQIFNGDWMSTKKIIHHCHFACCCTSKKDSLRRAKAAICEVLFAAHPSTPAVSRWTSCVKSARVYLLANVGHGIMQQAFQRMYRPKKRKTNNDDPCLHDGEQAMVALKDLLALPSSDSAIFQRQLRYRSSRAADWLASRNMTIELAVGVLLSGPVDQLLGWVFATQSKELHKAACPEELPLVGLASPYSQGRVALDNLCRMLSEDAGDNDLLFVMNCLAHNIEQECERDFAHYELLQHSILMVAAEVYDRLIEPFSRWPWRLALLLERRLHQDDRVRIAREFVDASACCLDDVATFVRTKFTTTEQLLSGIAGIFLQALFSQKISNIACETNFARAGTQHRVQAGKTAKLASMGAKHVLAEVTSLHEKWRRQQVGSSRNNSLQDAYADADIQHLPPIVQNRSQSAARQSAEGAERRPQKRNGWIVFLQDQFNHNVPTAGECRTDNRQRVFASAQLQWSRLSSSEKAEYSRQAKAMNILSKSDSNMQLLLEENSTANQQIAKVGAEILQPVSNISVPIVASDSSDLQHAGESVQIQSFSSTGSWGIGDCNNGIAEHIVEATIGNSRKMLDEFVSSWTRTVGAPCVETPFPAITQQLHRCCKKAIRERKLADQSVQKKLSSLKNLVRMCRKRRQQQYRKTRCGFGGCHKPEVLLLFDKDTQQLQGWLIAKLKLNELGLLLVSLDIDTTSGIASIVLKADQHTGKLMPLYTTMEELAVWSASIVQNQENSRLQWQLSSEYKVLTLLRLQLEIPFSLNEWSDLDIVICDPEETDADMGELRTLTTHLQQAKQGLRSKPKPRQSSHPSSKAKGSSSTAVQHERQHQEEPEAVAESNDASLRFDKDETKQIAKSYITQTTMLL